MKSTTVPAQIMTVEDKITGNLTLSQIMLLASPVFFNFLVYALLPWPLKLDTYKLVLMSITAIVMCGLAVRVRGKIILEWLITVSRFSNRPRFYVYNKNEPSRIKAQPEEKELKPKPGLCKEKELRPPILLEEIFRAETILKNRQIRTRFRIGRKGELYVTITEVE
jgi:hypothetical protein